MIGLDEGLGRALIVTLEGGMQNICYFGSMRTCLNPHLMSSMTDSARCTYEHSRFQSLSPDQV